MIDFSKLGQEPKTIESPYKHDDEIHFVTKNRSPRNIVKIDATLLFTRHRFDFNADLYKAEIERDGETQIIELIFHGQRRDDLNNGALHEHLMTIHHQNCAKGDYHSEIKKDLVIEGAWVPRNWKDAKGKWHKSWQIFVARWSFELNGEEITESALPIH